jgi:hypothetical protein
MSRVNPGKRFLVVRLQKYLVAFHEPPRAIVRLAGRRPGQHGQGIGTTFGISLMALAWHLGTQSYQAGNHGYPESEQARPAFAVLAAIVLASRAQARGPAERPREADPSGADQ